MEPFDTFVKLDPLLRILALVILSVCKPCLCFFHCLHHGRIILEILKNRGIERLFEIIFVPSFLKLFGIQKEAMNIIIVGMDYRNSIWRWYFN